LDRTGPDRTGPDRTAWPILSAGAAGGACAANGAGVALVAPFSDLHSLNKKQF